MAALKDNLHVSLQQPRLCEKLGFCCKGLRGLRAVCFPLERGTLEGESQSGQGPTAGKGGEPTTAYATRLMPSMCYSHSLTDTHSRLHSIPLSTRDRGGYLEANAPLASITGVGNSSLWPPNCTEAALWPEEGSSA